MVEKVNCWINTSLGIPRIGLRYKDKEVSHFRKLEDNIELIDQGVW